MRKLITLLVVSLLLACGLNRSYGLEHLEQVTPQRAKALGLNIKANAAGPDAVRIELDFAIEGELKEYHRVALELHDGGKLLATSTLKEETKPGRVVVSFAADRARLHQFTLKVVTQQTPRTRVGHVIQVMDFVDLEKLR